MHYNENNFIRVSELQGYYLCPRLAYFRRRRPPETGGFGVRAGFFKALSLELAPVALSQGAEAGFACAVERACADSLAVYGPEFEAVVDAAGREALEMGEDIIRGLAEEKARRGEAGLSCVLRPAAAGVSIYSGRLRLAGSVDKVVVRDGSMAPVIVSAAPPPTSGLHASDRVRLAAYAMLLAEKYGHPCDEGGVEYVRGWSLRWAEVRYEDRRRALYARNRILDMGLGRMPDAVRGKWCARCGHEDACGTRPSLLSALFGKD